MVHVLIQSNPSKEEWLLTYMSGSTHIDDRKMQWNFIKDLSENVFQPWIVLGDLNIHIQNKGQSASSLSYDNWVRSVIDFDGLMDLGFIGHNYTWTDMLNGRGYKRRRLDMALHNGLWIQYYPDSRVFHLPFRASDHCPILLSTESKCSRPSKAWKFYKCWLRDSSCSNIIQHTWSASINRDRFIDKLNNTRKVLAKWNREDFGHIGEHVSYYKNLFSHLQSLPFSDSNSEQIQIVIQQLSHWEKIEAEYWKQKAGDHWIMEDDNNTAYFHSRANRKRAKNT
ncbi:uncharacterized protein LOC113325068 [Papaver somniferum]|uniref:uncharacterized protein LOC113325068 n=1 Tax=Papaver somniferum TaxID=3469 RepID=UPI000E705BFF|nr:uncharacterized protein LOC113325068 [Papaver somniferum]